MIAIDPAFISELRSLPLADKQRLVEILLADLDQPDPHIEAEWVGEAKRRDAAYAACAMPGRTFREIFGEDP